MDGGVCGGASEAERTQALPMRNTASAATILTSSSIFMMRFTEPFGTRSVVGVFSFMFDIAASDASFCRSPAVTLQNRFKTKKETEAKGRIWFALL